MKISTKGKYALEIVTDLAIYSDEKHPQSLRNIAKRRDLSEKYLERIIRELRDAGIVQSIRGAQGGYCLNVPPEKLSVLSVLTAAEGELAPVECLTKDGHCGIMCGICPTKQLWGDMWKIIRDTAEEVTVEKLVCEAQSILT